MRVRVRRKGCTGVGRGAMLVGGALLLGACGGSDESSQPERAQTQTVIKTVGVPSGTTHADAAPPSGTPVVPGDDTTGGGPLPSGVTALDGTYVMNVQDDSSEGDNLAIDDTSPDPARWRFTTTCQGGSCTVAMRRQLDGGAFKSLTLRPDAGRPGVYAANSTGMDECAIPKAPAETRQHYSVKVNSSSSAGGRATANSIDAYFTETSKSCDDPNVKSIVSWKGSRQP